MFHRIEMNVVDVPPKVGFIPDRMLPIATLPNTFFSFDDLARRSRSCPGAARESALDQRPTGGEVGIIFGQSPNCMEVVWQNTYCNGFKRLPTLSELIGPSQTFDFLNEQSTRTVGKNDREEQRAALDLCASIVRHDHLYRV